jgi:hypothetical protein
VTVRPSQATAATSTTKRQANGVGNLYGGLPRTRSWLHRRDRTERCLAALLPPDVEAQGVSEGRVDGIFDHERDRRRCVSGTVASLVRSRAHLRCRVDATRQLCSVRGVVGLAAAFAWLRASLRSRVRPPVWTSTDSPLRLGGRSRIHGEAAVAAVRGPGCRERWNHAKGSADSDSRRAALNGASSGGLNGVQKSVQSAQRGASKSLTSAS